MGTVLVLLVGLLVPLALANIGGSGGPLAEPPHPMTSIALARSGHHNKSSRRRAAASLPQVTLSVAANASAVPVPSSFFGLSTEYWSLPLFERDMPAFERVIRLLHVAGDGPLILRIGGDSADHSFWHRRWRPLPSWAFELTPAYLARLKALVLRDRVKLIVDLNLVTDTPLIAADWARAAETYLPHGSIVGFEIGNEPDLYSRRYWRATVAGSPFDGRPLPFELTPATYVQDFAAYAHVLGENSPDIPLVGPAVAHPRVSLPFISTLIRDQRPEVGMVTGHLYPYSACVREPKQPDFPTVLRLLSHKAAAAFATDIAGAVSTAHAAGLKFRLTEFNSITCGGKSGVSNSFATALWAPDALFTAMRTGADGANLHVRENAINAAFTVNGHGLSPRPLLYGLLMFTRTLGPQARLVKLHMKAARSLDLSAWAVQVKSRILHVLLIDKGRRSIRVDVHVRATAPGTVQRLLAPSPYSHSGVTLNGQKLNSAGEWTGTETTETVSRAGHGGYEVTVSARSAALMSVPLASEHHGRVAVAKHAVLAVGLNRARKH